jgi:hypothetical protein
MQAYLAHLRAHIRAGEAYPHGPKVDVPGRYKFNRILETMTKHKESIHGGGVVGRGTYKCIFDNDPVFECVDADKKNPVRADEVQVLLPVHELDGERDAYHLILNSRGKGPPFTPAFIQKAMVIITPHTFVCETQPKFPDIHTDGQLQPNCKMEESIIEMAKDTGMALAILPRGAPISNHMATAGPAILDIMYTLWRFSRNGIVHGDIKKLNVLVIKNRGAVIDFGFTTTRTRLVRWTTTSSDEPGIDTMHDVEYAVWPKILSAWLGADTVTKAAFTRSQTRAVLNAIDKTGFMQVLFSVHRAHNSSWRRVWDSVKTPDEYPIGKLPSDEWDPLSQRTFKTWPEMYAVVYTFLGSPENRPASMTLDYWHKTDNQPQPKRSAQFAWFSPSTWFSSKRTAIEPQTTDSVAPGPHSIPLHGPVGPTHIPMSKKTTPS